MDIKLLLIKSITLLYRTSQLENKDPNVKHYVSELIKDIVINESNLTLDAENRIMVGLRDILLKMIRSPEGHVYEYNDFIQSIKLATEDRTELFNAIRDAIAMKKTEDELNQICTSIRHELDQYVRDQKVLEIISKANSTIKYRPQDIKDMKKFVQELCGQLTPYQTQASEEEDPGIIARVRLNRAEEVEAVFNNIKKEASGETVIKTPWQAINRMIRGGFRRGQMATVAALQHRNKSGFSLACLLGAAIYNDPKEQMLDPSKKPCLVLVSAENELEKALGDLYVMLRENLEGVKIDDAHFASVDTAAQAKFIVDFIENSGYQFEIIRTNPSQWTYLDICNAIMRLEREGLEIHFMLIDYLNMFPKTGLAGENEAVRIQTLFNVMRNFTSARKIACLTPHQLSPDALELHRQGKGAHLVNIVSSGDYYAGSKGIGREVDLELFLHIVQDSGRSYQCIRRGKHRLTGVTEEKYLYTILPFEEIGGLRFDLDKNDTSLSKIGATRKADGTEEEPYYDGFDF